MSNLENSKHLEKVFAATELVRQGFGIVPMFGFGDADAACSCRAGPNCKSPGKHPKARNGVHSAVSSLDGLEELFRGSVNLGIACGSKSGVVVLDIDPKNGGDISFAALLSVTGLGEDLKTLKEVTGGGGNHYYFLFPTGIALPKQNPRFPGIDMLVDGSISVCAPSRHKSGRKYEFLNQNPGVIVPKNMREQMIQLPPSLIREWLDKGKPRKEDLGAYKKEIPEGSRNIELFKQARALFGSTGNKEATLDTLNQVNKRCCKPPLEESEVAAIVESAIKYIDADGLNARINYHKERLWSPIESFSSSGSLIEGKKIPEQMVPEILFKKADDLARRLGTSRDATLMVAVSGLSGAIGRRCALFPKPDYKVVPNLSCLLLGGPSAQKSPILKEMLNPLYSIQRELSLKNESDSREHAKAKYGLQLKIGELKGKLKKASNEEKEESIKEIAQLKLELEEKFEPKRILVTDATIERLIELMQSNPYGLIMVWDEISGLFKLFEREGRESERQTILSLISGDIGQMQDRVGRGHVFAEHVLLTIIGGIQPEVLREIMPKTLMKGSGEDGMLQRFPLIAFVDQPKDYTLVLDEINPEIESKYLGLFGQLVGIEEAQF